MKRSAYLIAAAYFVCSLGNDHMVCLPADEKAWMEALSLHSSDMPKVRQTDVYDLLEDLGRQVKDVQDRLPKKKGK